MFVVSGQSNYDRVCADLFAVVRDKRRPRRPLLPWAAATGPDGTFVAILQEEWCVRETAFTMATADSIRRVPFSWPNTCSGRGLTRQKAPGAALPRFEGWCPVASFIKTHLEDKMAQAFSGRRNVLKERMHSLGAQPYGEGTSADLALVLNPLPKVPVLCLFWDGDEEFPASFQFLFDASAPAYLDLESLVAALQYIYSRITEEA